MKHQIDARTSEAAGHAASPPLDQITAAARAPGPGTGAAGHHSVFTQTESAWENVAKLDQDFFPKEYPSLTIDSFTIIGSGPKNGAGLRLTEERLLSTAGRNPMGAWRRFNE